LCFFFVFLCGIAITQKSQKNSLNTLSLKIEETEDE
jgi:hypothetical protein